MIWPVLGLYRAFRGGSWSLDPQYARVAFRNLVAPDYRNGTLGVRLVRTAP